MNSCWGNLKLQNQALFVFLLTSLIVVCVLVTIDVITYYFVTLIYQQASRTLIIQENDKFSAHVQARTIQNVSLVLNRSFRQIVNANYLFQYSSKLEYLYIQQPSACLNNLTGLDAYQQRSTLCYGIFGTKSPFNKLDRQLLNYTALTTSLLPMQETLTSLVASYQPNKYMTQYPAITLSNTYDPQARAWYVQYYQQKGTSLATFCTPYYSTGGFYVIAQSTGLTLPNGTNVGVIASPLTLLNVLSSVKYNMNLTITNNQGLIYSVGAQNSAVIYLYNESYTGFNKEQQIEILKNLASKESLTLYNSKLNQNVTIKALPLKKTGLVLVFQSNSLYEEELIHGHLNNIASSIITSYWKVLSNMIGFIIFFIIVSVLILIRMFKPVRDLIQTIQRKIQPYNFKELKQQSTQLSSTPQLYALQKAFHLIITSMSQSSLSKNKECAIINRIQFFNNKLHDQDHFYVPLQESLNQIDTSLLELTYLTRRERRFFYQELKRQLLSIQ